MKPRVAEAAAACLNALNPAQRCDAARLALCAHSALMNACIETDATPSTRAPLAAGAPDDLAARCDGIVRACSTGAAPTLRDCRATLSGLSPLGRDRAAACMNAHCDDKGLVGCEVGVDK